MEQILLFEAGSYGRRCSVKSHGFFSHMKSILQWQHHNTVSPYRRCKVILWMLHISCNWHYSRFCSLARSNYAQIKNELKQAPYSHIVKTTAVRFLSIQIILDSFFRGLHAYLLQPVAISSIASLTIQNSVYSNKLKSNLIFQKLTTCWEGKYNVGGHSNSMKYIPWNTFHQCI